MATMGTTVAMVAIGIIVAVAMVTMPATAIIIMATTLASMAISSSMGMIVGITSITKAATTTIAAIDLGSHPET